MGANWERFYTDLAVFWGRFGADLGPYLTPGYLTPVSGMLSPWRESWDGHGDTMMALVDALRHLFAQGLNAVAARM